MVWALGFWGFGVCFFFVVGGGGFRVLGFGVLRFWGFGRFVGLRAQGLEPRAPQTPSRKPSIEAYAWFRV